MNPALLSSKTDEWATPPDFFAKVEAEFGPFDLDPCATAENAKAPKFYTKEQDGLTKHWFGNVWVNPPVQTRQAWHLGMGPGGLPPDARIP